MCHLVLFIWEHNLHLRQTFLWGQVLMVLSRKWNDCHWFLLQKHWNRLACYLLVLEFLCYFCLLVAGFCWNGLFICLFCWLSVTLLCILCVIPFDLGINCIREGILLSTSLFFSLLYLNWLLTLFGCLRYLILAECSRLYLGFLFYY
jgi:hypothetical protein